MVSHGGAIRSFIHATIGLVPPPLENGAVFQLRFEGGAFVTAEQLTPDAAAQSGFGLASCCAREQRIRGVRRSDVALAEQFT